MDSMQITYTGELQRLRPEPGDVLVLHVDAHLDRETAERIKAKLMEFAPECKALVIDKGMKLTVMSAAETEIAA